MRVRATQAPLFILQAICITLMLLALFSLRGLHAADLPLAAGSPMVGVTFDDRPLMLPVQRNFQMAMLTSSSELGRSCGRMEAYGWRMAQNEQARVNQIFNNTVDRLRLTGYTIEPQNLTSVSRDITLFTADRPDKHFLFMWSAGEIGLAMVLCETSKPMYPPRTASMHQSVLPQPLTSQADSAVVAAQLAAPEAPRQTAMLSTNKSFTPVGVWAGFYTCSQGVTGGTLEINRLNGENFEGTFKFYPTGRNPNVPAGSYSVYGQYDPESHRILINPGTWLQRPKDYYNTVMVGSFDSASNSFSAYFQGITGCTSFEAKYVGGSSVTAGSKMKVGKLGKDSAKAKTKKKHKVVKPKPKPQTAVSAKASAPAKAQDTVAPTVAAPASTTAAPTPVVPAVAAPPPSPAVVEAPKPDVVPAAPTTSIAPASATVPALALPTAESTKPSAAMPLLPPVSATPTGTSTDSKKPDDGIVLPAPSAPTTTPAISTGTTGKSGS